MAPTPLCRGPFATFQVRLWQRLASDIALPFGVVFPHVVQHPRIACPITTSERLGKSSSHRSNRLEMLIESMPAWLAIGEESNVRDRIHFFRQPEAKNST